MARNRQVVMLPGETLDLAKSLRGDMSSGDTLTGSTPTVSVWLKSNSTYTDASDDFTIASAAVNTGTLTDYNGDTIAVGDGVEFRLTASTTRGTYEIRISCAADDGSVPATTMDLVIAGPGVPA